MKPNIHDVLSPTAIALAKIIGYGLIWIGWGVIILAGLRMGAEARAAYNRSKYRW